MSIDEMRDMSVILTALSAVSAVAAVVLFIVADIGRCWRMVRRMHSRHRDERISGAERDIRQAGPGPAAQSLPSGRAKEPATCAAGLARTVPLGRCPELIQDIVYVGNGLPQPAPDPFRTGP